MNQRAAWGAFVGGLATFLFTVSEILSRHQAWSEFTATPAGVSHVLLIGAAFAVLVCGALGVQLPRSSGPYGDRAGDPLSKK